MLLSDFEFRYRFWLIAAVFWLGFTLYAIDHVNVVVRAENWLGVYPDARPEVERMVFGIGAGLTFINALLRSWATAYLRSELVHDSALHAERLVAEGPYRYVRNPLYLGNILMAVGMGLLASTLGWLLIVTGMYIITRRLIRREEAALLEANGSSFSNYMRTVPRLLPRLRPAVPAGSLTPDWGQGLRGEAFSWILMLAAMLFAITLQLRLAYLIMFAGIALYVVRWMVGQRP